MLDLRAPSGELLIDEAPESSRSLEETGTYLICIGSVRGNTNYVLDVTIS